MTPAQRAIRRVFRTVGSRRFRYGETDCANLAAAVLYELTGRRYLSEADYCSEAGAQALLGAESLEGLVSEKLGPPADVIDMEDGDIVLCRIGRLELLGVWANGRAVCKCETGLTDVPPCHCRAVWHWRALCHR